MAGHEKARITTKNSHEFGYVWKAYFWSGNAPAAELALQIRTFVRASL